MHSIKCNKRTLKINNRNVPCTRPKDTYFETFLKQGSFWTYYLRSPEVAWLWLQDQGSILYFLQQKSQLLEPCTSDLRRQMLLQPAKTSFKYSIGYTSLKHFHL